MDSQNDTLKQFIKTSINDESKNSLFNRLIAKYKVQNTEVESNNDWIKTYVFTIIIMLIIGLTIVLLSLIIDDFKKNL